MIKLPILFLGLLILVVRSAVAADVIPNHNPFKKPDLVRSTSSRSPATPTTVSKELPPVRATLVGGDSPLALIKDSVIRVGAEVDGYRLIEIREGIVVFEKDGVKAEVRVRQTDSQSEQEEENSNVE